MPRNRRPRDREEKRDEIVTAAARLFAEVGFDETPMTHVANAAGVTTNTIYWYFEDKDAVLVAVLDRLLAEALAEQASGQAPGPSAPLADQLVWAIARLTRFHRLVTVVHSRSVNSAPVAAWHDQFHALTDAVLAEGFRHSGMREVDIPAATRMGVFVVEGLLTHPQNDEELRAVVELLAAGVGPRQPTTP